MKIQSFIRCFDEYYRDFISNILGPILCMDRSPVCNGINLRKVTTMAQSDFDIKEPTDKDDLFVRSVGVQIHQMVIEEAQSTYGLIGSLNEYDMFRTYQVMIQAMAISSAAFILKTTDNPVLRKKLSDGAIMALESVVVRND